MCFVLSTLVSHQTSLYSSIIKAMQTYNMVTNSIVLIANISQKYCIQNDRSTTPVASVDSAMESWDSSAPDNGQIYGNIGVTVMSNGRPPLLPKPKKTSNGTK